MTSSDATQLASIDLADLAPPKVGLSEAWCLAHAEHATLCLTRHNHPSGVPMALTGQSPGTVAVLYGAPDPRAAASWEIEASTEGGAYAVALLVSQKLLEIPRFERGYRGTGRGFDFYGGTGDGELFQKAARLEISGILEGTPAMVVARLNQKSKQIGNADAELPAYAIVVEFSQPMTALAVK